MKKSWTLILILLILPSIYAVEFSMNENFSQGETLTAKVSGNFITSITKGNIFFYKDRHIRIPLEYDVGKIGEDYYIYALLSNKEPYDNYSLIIENVQYMKGNQISEEDIIKDFSITNETADFFIKPGFVVSSGNFYLEVQNLLDNLIIVNIKTDVEKRDIFILPEKNKEDSISLNSGQIKKINFEIDEGEPTFQIIELSTNNTTYEIPVYISSDTGKESEEILSFEPSDLIFSVNTNTLIKKTIILQNKGNELENISLSLSNSLEPFVNLSTNNIETLENNSNFSIELSFFSSLEREIEGILKARTENETTDVFISVEFLANYTSLDITDEVSSTKTCAEKNGTLFNTETHKCGAEYENVKDGWCCYGAISQVEKSSSGKMIAVIIVFLIIVLIWFYLRKYRKMKRPVNLLKIARGKK